MACERSESNAVIGHAVRGLIALTLAFISTRAAAEIVVRQVYRLSPAEEGALIKLAREAVGRPLAVIEITAWDGKTKDATVIFEPYAWTSSTFLLDSVTCERSLRIPWHCNKPATRRYLHFGTISGSVYLYGEIELDMARELVEYSRSSSCPVRTVSGKLDFRELLSEPALGATASASGTYMLSSGGCALQMTVRDGKVVAAVKLGILE
jgi:hypothetical protein